MISHVKMSLMKTSCRAFSFACVHVYLFIVTQKAILLSLSLLCVSPLALKSPDN